MATLTKKEIQTMLSSALFLDRCKASLLDFSHYIDTLAVSSESDYNLKFQKRKRYAKQVLNGALPQISVYTDHFLNNYKAIDPSLIITDSEDEYFGQLPDSVLFSAYREVPFDWLADVVIGNDTDPIIW